MKRTVVILSLIFALAIAVSVSIPTLAASDNTVVSGSVPAKIIVTAPGDITGLSLDPETTPYVTGTATDGNVKSNKGWTGSAVAASTAHSGHMMDGSLWLASEMTISTDKTNYSPASTGTTLSGSAGQTTLTLDIRQIVGWADITSNNYTITIVFTATQS